MKLADGKFGRYGWLFLVAVVLLVFGQTVRFSSLNYDDPAYITANPHVREGLKAESLRWALTGVGETNLWHPLTWLSHQVDVSMFGLENSDAHHAVNVFWHALGAVGFLFLLGRIFRSQGLAFFLALVWAVHPQRVESVAWLSERKDVLAGALMFWSWWSWEKWRDDGRARYYGIALLLFVGAGLSKPSVVPLPLVLMAVEWWRGTDRRSVYKTTLALVPFLLVSALVAGLTFHFQRHGGMSDATSVVPFSRRLALMPVSLAWYAKSLVWPVPGRLWVYPPEGMGATLVSIVILVCVTAVILLLARRERVIALGGIITVLMWLPVSGLVPVSFYFVADRYSYFIQPGLLVLVGGLLALIRWEGMSRRSVLVMAGLAAVILMAFTAVRTNYWKDSSTLFSREMRVNPRSLLAPIQLGLAQEESSPRAAVASFRHALEIDPESGLAAMNAGRVLLKMGDRKAAEEMLVRAIECRVVRKSTSFLLLAQMRMEEGHPSEAYSILKRGLDRLPGRSEFYRELGVVALGGLKRPDEAAQWFLRAWEVGENDPDALQGYGVALMEAGEIEKGRATLEELVRRFPERVRVRQFLER